MNTDDIEIYAKGLGLNTIKSWLEAHFDQIKTQTSGKVVHDLILHTNGISIPVMIVENAVGKAWTSIWFKSAQTLWEDDMSCARSLHAFIPCRVRANATPWADGADMDEWWQLAEDGTESTVSWPNAG